MSYKLTGDIRKDYKLVRFINANIHMIWLALEQAKKADMNLIVLQGEDYPIVMQWNGSFYTRELVLVSTEITTSYDFSTTMNVLETQIGWQISDLKDTN